MKKYHHRHELQSRELNLVLRKTAMIVRQVTDRLQEGGLRKSVVRISKVFGEVMKAKLKIIVQVIFHIDENFNNPRK